MKPGPGSLVATRRPTRKDWKDDAVATITSKLAKDVRRPIEFARDAG